MTEQYSADDRVPAQRALLRKWGVETNDSPEWRAAADTARLMETLEESGTLVAAMALRDLVTNVMDVFEGRDNARDRAILANEWPELFAAIHELVSYDFGPPAG